jgi:hypothetical protein
MGKNVITYKNASTQIKKPNSINLSTLEGTVKKLSIFPTAVGCRCPNKYKWGGNE